MKYLVELVFGLGLLSFGGIALLFILRFLLMVWIVQVATRVLQNILRALETIFHAMVFVIGTAMVGAFITGLGLQIGANLVAGGPEKSVGSAMPVLSGLLAFFVIVAVRGSHWASRYPRRGSDPVAARKFDSGTRASGYPAELSIPTRQQSSRIW